MQPMFPGMMGNPGGMGGLPTVGMRPSMGLGMGGLGAHLGMTGGGNMVLPPRPGFHPGLQAGAFRPPMGLIRPGAGIIPHAGLNMATSKAMTPGVYALPKTPGLVGAPLAGLGLPLSSSAPCTVYVGRISTEVTDDFVRQLLEKCGKVAKWNRAADPNTAKLTSFGFCDFEEPAGVYRALEFLHDRQLCDKKLLVKCEEKAKETIVAWKGSRREELAKKKAEAAAKEKKEEKKEDSKEGEKKEGEEAKPPAPAEAKAPAQAPAPAPPGALTDEMLDEELRKESKGVEDDLVRLLRDKNKGFPELAEGAVEVPKDNKDMPPIPNGEHKENKDVPPTPKDEPKDAGKDKKPRLTRSEERKVEKEREAKAPVSRHYRQPRREREREQRVKDRDRDIEKEYQYRIREFERGEEKRVKRLKQDLRDLEMPEPPSERDKRKFQDRDLDFGEDERDVRDWKRHREDRVKERAREAEKDVADRAEEEKEAEDEIAKQKEEEEAKKKAEEDAVQKKREEEEAEKRRKEEEEKSAQEAAERMVREEREAKEAEERQVRDAAEKAKQEAAAAKLMQSIQMDMQKSGDKGGKAASGVHAAFKDTDDVGPDGQPRKHKPLQRLDTPAPAQEVKLRDDEMRRLIQQVPTDKAKAFAYDIDWQAVHDHNIIEKKLRPWVKKKVTEYLGAEEQGMIEFIMRKVTAHEKPDTILAELEGFLDQEAENFTLKMWRMLIFEVLRVKAR